MSNINDCNGCRDGNKHNHIFIDVISEADKKILIRQLKEDDWLILFENSYGNTIEVGEISDILFNTEGMNICRKRTKKEWFNYKKDDTIGIWRNLSTDIRIRQVRVF